jgi:hypothetical protein
MIFGSSDVVSIFGMVTGDLAISPKSGVFAVEMACKSGW